MVFHVDMDAFYASVEQLENPHMRGKPVIVGGVDSARGVVSTASYEARVFGIHSAMSVAEARKRCPHGIFINGRQSVYADYSKRLMDCLSEFSPSLEQISVDEAFMDMTGSEKLFGDAPVSGMKLKQMIQDRLGITASIGIAENKFLAKLASDVNKPNGLKVVLPSEVQSFLDPLPVGKLWGVGKKSVQSLHQLGLYHIAQLKKYSLENLVSHVGENFAHHIYALAEGKDNRELVPERVEKSISHERTFEEDTGDTDLIGALLLDLSERVARRARKDELQGRTITFIWRNPDFSRQSNSQTLSEATDSSQIIFETVLKLFTVTSTLLGEDRLKKSGPRQNFVTRPRVNNRQFRLIGVRLSQFILESQQLSLFTNEKPQTNVDVAMDAVRNKFGEGAIRRARLTDMDS